MDTLGTSGDGGGEAQDFESFYRSAYQPLSRLGHVLTGSQVVGEDLAQEALAALFTHWDAVSSPKAFARTSIVNAARRHWRHRSRERKLRAEMRTEVRVPPEVDECWSAIQRLGNRDRIVLVLRYYEDLSVDDIARMLGIPPGTVKARIHRSLEMRFPRLTGHLL